jgi:hypothetical protein
MPTKTYTKAQRLMMIRDGLRNRTGQTTITRLGKETVVTVVPQDKERDAQLSLEAVERETGQSFGASRMCRVIVPGTRDKFSEPIYREITPQSEIIADMSTYYPVAPDAQTGHRISIPLNITSRVIVQDGRTLAEPLATVERSSYSVSMQRPAVDPPLRRPKWSEDRTMLSKALHSWDVFRNECFHSHADYIALRWNNDPLLNVPRAEFCLAPMDPLIRKYRAINAAQAEMELQKRMADKHGIMLDQSTVPQHPAVSRPSDLDSLGIARPVFRPRAKWFNVCAVPLSASSAIARGASV